MIDLADRARARSSTIPPSAMMTIANLDTIWVTANVPGEGHRRSSSPGRPSRLRFSSYPDEVFTGKVLFVSDVIEPDTRRNKVRIAFENPDKLLKPNMFADAHLRRAASRRG